MKFKVNDVIVTNELYLAKITDCKMDIENKKNCYFIELLTNEKFKEVCHEEDMQPMEEFMDKYYDDSMRIDDIEAGFPALANLERNKSKDQKATLKEDFVRVNKKDEYEMVDHPSHYHPGDYEAIKVIEAWLGKEGCYQFCLGNALKYISRLDSKPSVNKSKDEKTIEDIEKAIWYLDYAKDMKNKD